jgi:adenosylhomocysteine nucleosidase
VDNPTPVLVCFAVKEEAKYFSPEKAVAACATMLTGIGRRNAERTVRERLEKERPGLVISAGFAGGLNPQLKAGAVVFDAGEPLASRLTEAGATRVRFYSAERVVVTAAEKAGLWKSDGADAVEMESAVIRRLCGERGIASATVRVISDAADEDLPLDFNKLMTAEDEIDYVRLARTVAFSPIRLPALFRFQRQTIQAAGALAKALHQSLAGRGGGG